MRRGIRGFIVGVVAALLGGCGAARSSTLRTEAGGATTAAVSGTQTVVFGGLAFDVPGGWPIYHLATDRHRCARLDVHAVYLGHQGADATCPARMVGRTETVHIEPLDQAAGSLASAGAAPQTLHGHQVVVQPFGDINHQIVASFPADGVLATVTYGPDKAAAQDVLASVRSAP